MKKRNIIILIILAMISVAEISSRIYYANEIFYYDRPLVYQYDSILNYTYKPDTIFILDDERFSINKQGFIGKDFANYSEDTFRIAIVGGCFVAGSINWNKYYSFCPMLQQLLRDNGQPASILNCGVDGGTRSLEIFNSIRYQIIKFKPDMILLEYDLPFCTRNLIRECYKDRFLEYPAYNPQSFETGKMMVDQMLKYKTVIDILYYSYTIRALARQYLNHERRQRHKKKCPKTELARYIELYETKKCSSVGDFEITEYSMGESIVMIKELQSELKKDGIPFFMYQYQNDRSIIDHAKENKLPLITLGLQYNEDDYFEKHKHLNEVGLKKTADRFCELIMKYKLIPEQ